MTVTTTEAPVSFAQKDGRLEAMRAEIDTAMERLADPEGWAQFLEAASTFHQYSFYNTMLILMQCPHATHVAAAGKKDGSTGWKKLGRHPKAGTKALWILAPAKHTRTVKDESTGEETKVSGVHGFFPVHVFDVSQTEGESLPESPVPYTPLLGEAPKDVIDELISMINSRGFQVQFTELAGATEGDTNFADKVVRVDAQSSTANQALTLAHELAHIVLGHGERLAEYHTGHNGHRTDMEVEAESVAHVLARHYGIPNGDAQFAYIANWAQGNEAKVKATADAVLAALREILPDA